MKWFVWLLAAALAGCASSTPPEPEPEGPAGLDVETEPDVGAISGVVVTEAISPIPMASIRIMASDTATTSDALGQFVFQDLAPGAYFLNISAPGYLPTQTSAAVEAGEVTKVRVLLVADPAPRPSHSTIYFEGYILAYMGTASFAVQLLTNASQLCKCQFDFEPGPGIHTFVYEAHWKPTIANQAGPDQMYWELTSRDPQHIESDYNESPILQDIPRDRYPEESVVWLARLTGDFAWPAYDQSYEMFITKFYVEGPPDGWSVVDEG